MMKNLLIILAITSAASAFGQNTCEEALSIEPGIYTVDVVDGPDEPWPICAGSPFSDDPLNSEWYMYTADADYSVTVTTDLMQNFGGDTRIQIYSGECGSLICVDGDDDGGEIGNGYLSIVNFQMQEGESVFIVFDNYWESDGFDFELSAEVFVPPTEGFSPVYFTLNGQKEAVADMNGDFLDDIIGISGTSIEIMFQQPDGSFVTEVFNHPQVAFMPSWSTTIADMDRNGYNDLMYGATTGVTFMLANEDGTAYEEFTDPASFGVFSQRGNFVDINNDGHLDVFMCHDVDPNVYWINDGENNFDFFQGGLGDLPGGGNYGSIWIDYDNDGDQDLFIAKCRGGNELLSTNQLHRNNGDGTFTEVAEEAGLADPMQTWSSAWGDFDNDGDLDVFVGASSFSAGSHKVMRNNGDGTFTDVTEGSGYEDFNFTSHENVTYDFDNDGYLDIRGAGNVIMMGNGDLTFTPYEIQAGNGPVGDFNNDGYLDILNGSIMYINYWSENNYLKFNTIGAESNINGIGARINVYTPNIGQQIREINSGNGFAYMSTLNAHFGLGSETEIDSVVINWPSGIVDVYTDVDINTTFVAEEGEGEEIVDPVSVSDHFLKNLLIYPNPAQDIIIIDAPVDIRSAVFTIYDLSGKNVLAGNLNKNQLNVSRLESGTYIIEIRMDNKNVQRKFVKQ